MKYIFCAFLLSYSFQLFASGDPVPTGGRSWALANASVANRDAFSFYNNPAGLSHLKNIYGFSCYDRRYNLADLQTISFGVIKPIKIGVVGLGISRFGGEYYHEHQLSIAYSQKINMVSLGAKINLLQTGIQDIGVKRVLTFEMGAIAELIPQKLLFGFHIYNFTQTKLASYQDERVPTVMKAGVSYHPIEKLMINIETEKDIDYPAIFKCGIEYEIVKHFKLRTGFSSKPFASYFGFGFSPKNLQFDYAFRSHPQLGTSHHISVCLKFKDIFKTKS